MKRIYICPIILFYPLVFFVKDPWLFPLLIFFSGSIFFLLADLLFLFWMRKRKKDDSFVFPDLASNQACIRVSIDQKRVPTGGPLFFQWACIEVFEEAKTLKSFQWIYFQYRYKSRKRLYSWEFDQIQKWARDYKIPLQKLEFPRDSLGLSLLKLLLRDTFVNAGLLLAGLMFVLNLMGKFS